MKNFSRLKTNDGYTAIRHRSATTPWFLPPVVVIVSGLLVSCSSETSDVDADRIVGARNTRSMAERLEKLAQQEFERGGFTVGMDTLVARRRQAVKSAWTFDEKQRNRMELSRELLLAGHNEEAIIELQMIQTLFDEHDMQNLFSTYHSTMATAYLRLAEETNCLARHGSESCLLPIRGGGVHTIREGASKAVDHLMASLAQDPSSLADRWLLNIAHMTLGEYPRKPVAPFLIPEQYFASEHDVGRFKNVGFDVGVAVAGLAGGSIIEDLDNDGHLDIMASGWGLREQMKYFHNQGNGKFADQTERAGLLGQVGGLNLSHADYDNDGDVDVLVLRGAWLRQWGFLPNSLLRNNGDGTFDDVTEDAGLLSFNPTQVGVWGDFDNDGWIDLFIGNESTSDSRHPCELFRNNGDGTFSNVAEQVSLDHIGFVKGAAWGDFDNDGRLDLYVSQLNSSNTLYHNEGRKGTSWYFRDVTRTAGVAEPRFSFPTWFWDYDNDGWLDLFVGSFPGFSVDTLGDIAAGYLDEPFKAPHPRLYHNNGDGTFTDVTKQAGLTKPMLIMGANFGDIDNDGYVDFYLGTGEPNLRTLVPNRMYRNAGDGQFQNVTTSGGFGHLQKGHGVAFGDVDNDGDQDIYIVMGGAYKADIAYNSLFLNPGHDKHWVTLLLEGVHSNRSGVGVRIEIITSGSSGRRSIHSMVSTGGSFGSSSLQQEIGLGDADSIETIKVLWPTSGEVQIFHDVDMDQFYRVREGTDLLISLSRQRTDMK